MQTVKNLVKIDHNKKLGNHRVEVYDFSRKFFYYATPICIVNDLDKTFIIDSSFGSQSTTRACNSYRREFESLGYTEQK